MNSSQNELGYFPQMPVCDKHLSSELNADFTLPDYKCEIRRLLSVQARVTPPSEYVSNSSAQLDGDICYKILYLGADGELYSVDLTDKYAFKLPLDFGFYTINPDDLTLICDVTQENVSARVLGPRKLTVKAKLSLHALGLTPELRTPNLVGSHNPSSIEKLICTTQSASVKKCASEPISFSDYYPLDGASESVRVIDCHSSVFLSECSAQASQINVRGEVIQKILYCNDSQSALPVCAIRKIPFTKALECAGVNSSFECSCICALNEERAEVRDDGISSETLVTFYVRAQRNTDASFVADAYSTDKETEASYSELKIPRALKAANGSLTQSEMISLEETGVSRDARIVDTCALAHIEACSLDNGRIELKGSCDYQLVFCLDGEYSCKSIGLPFRYELECANKCENDCSVNLFASVSASSAKARLDGERIFLDCELCFDVFALCEGEARLLSEMIFTQSRSKCKSELLLCYPDKDATLWSVAKQYGEPLSALRKRNSINDGEGSIKRRFLIV